MDFSDDGRFPATIEVVLGNGYRYKQSATDDEARALIAELGERVIAYEQEYARKDATA